MSELVEVLVNAFTRPNADGSDPCPPMVATGDWRLAPEDVERCARHYAEHVADALDHELAGVLDELKKLTYAWTVVGNVAEKQSTRFLFHAHAEAIHDVIAKVKGAA